MPSRQPSDCMWIGLNTKSSFKSWTKSTYFDRWKEMCYMRFFKWTLWWIWSTRDSVINRSIHLCRWWLKGLGAYSKGQRKSRSWWTNTSNGCSTPYSFSSVFPKAFSQIPKPLIKKIEAFSKKFEVPFKIIHFQKPKIPLESPDEFLMNEQYYQLISIKYKKE